MNLNLVIDTSQFKPFDISPALLILHDYRDRYDKYQEQLQKIAEENGLYILPDTEDNKQYRDTMDRYKADFEAAASDFSNHMNLLNQKQLLNLFRRLRSEITPINKAIEAYNKDIDKITALGPASDVTVANRDNRKISDYYGGINPGILYRSNKTIQATAAGVMQGLDNALMSSPEIVGDIANQYYILKQKGIDGQNALLTILNGRPHLKTEEGVQGVSQVMDALNNVYSQFAFDEGTPENKLIWELVVTGAIQGILAPKYSLQGNQNFLNDALKYNLRAAKREEDFKYVRDADGNIIGLNPEYLKEINTHRTSTYENKELEVTGKRIDAGNGIKYSNKNTITTITADAVPLIIRDLHPEAIGWKVEKNDKNEHAAYYPIYKKIVKVTPDGTTITDTGGGEGGSDYSKYE